MGSFSIWDHFRYVLITFARPISNTYAINYGSCTAWIKTGFYHSSFYHTNTLSLSISALAFMYKGPVPTYLRSVLFFPGLQRSLEIRLWCIIFTITAKIRYKLIGVSNSFFSMIPRPRIFEIRIAFGNLI